MIYDESANEAAERMLTAALAVKDAMTRGDVPDRVIDYLSDVTKWSQRTIEDVNSAGEATPFPFRTARPGPEPKPIPIEDAEADAEARRVTDLAERLKPRKNT